MQRAINFKWNTTVKIGTVVRMLRARQDLTLAALSKKSGLSVPYLSLVESGKRTPTLQNLDAISEALGIPRVTLLLLSSSPEEIKSLSDSTRSKLLEALQLLLQELDESQANLSTSSDSESQ